MTDQKPQPKRKAFKGKEIPLPKRKVVMRDPRKIAKGSGAHRARNR